LAAWSSVTRSGGAMIVPLRAGDLTMPHLNQDTQPLPGSI
jgi:hypothetical protein